MANKKKGASGKSASGKSGGKAATTLSPRILQGFYRDMLLIRRFEERAGQLYGMGLIGGFCHLYIGQEAVVVGVQAALDKDDSIITAYRDHGHMLAAGIDAKAVMAELTGRVDGISAGKGGSMHMFSTAHGFYGGHGIVGAQIPLGTGIAFANKYRGSDALSVAYMGDGAANQGQVFEAFNMAKLWNLPVIYIIENNRYAMGTSVKRATGAPDLSKRGAAHGIPGVRVDGMRVEEVYAAAKKAVKHVRSGKGPIILELKTYRYRGHSMSDPAKYRSKEEVAEVRAKSDPIDGLRGRMIEAGIMDDEAAKALDKELRGLVSDAADFAQNSPEPDAAALYTDVLAEA